MEHHSEFEFRDELTRDEIQSGLIGLNDLVERSAITATVKRTEPKYAYWPTSSAAQKRRRPFIRRHARTTPREKSNET